MTAELPLDLNQLNQTHSQISQTGTQPSAFASLEQEIDQKINKLQEKSSEKLLNLNRKMNELKETYQKLLSEYKANLGRKEEGGKNGVGLSLMQLEKFADSFLAGEREKMMREIDEKIDEVSRGVEAVRDGGWNNCGESKRLLAEMKDLIEGGFNEVAENVSEMSLSKRDTLDKIIEQLNNEFGNVNELVSESAFNLLLFLFR